MAEHYLPFLLFSVVLILIPGPDTAVTLANSILGGRRRGGAAVVGICMANVVIGMMAATGLGVLVSQSRPVFNTIKVLGVIYLVYLAIQAIRSMRRAEYPSPLELEQRDPSKRRADAIAGFRQGALSTATNPKVMVFYLAVLPQFMPADSSLLEMVPYACTPAALGGPYLFSLVLVVERARGWFSRTKVRQMMDGVTASALLGFSFKLASE